MAVQGGVHRTIELHDQRRVLADQLGRHFRDRGFRTQHMLRLVDQAEGADLSVADQARIRDQFDDDACQPRHGTRGHAVGADDRQVGVTDMDCDELHRLFLAMPFRVRRCLCAA